MSKQVMQQSLDAFEEIMFEKDAKSCQLIARNARYALREELAKPEQTDLRKAAEMALDALKNGRNVRKGMGSTKLQISFENEAIAAIEAELALDKKADNARELGLDYEPEQPDLRKAAEMALGALIDMSSDENSIVKRTTARKSLRQALAKPDATIINEGSKPWIGLTDDEMHKIVADRTPDDATLEELNDFVLAVRDAEAKLKEKNAPSN